jgi:hypothetical protein
LPPSTAIAFAAPPPASTDALNCLAIDGRTTIGRLVRRLTGEFVGELGGAAASPEERSAAREAGLVAAASETLQLRLLRGEPVDVAHAAKLAGLAASARREIQERRRRKFGPSTTQRFAEIATAPT